TDISSCLAEYASGSGDINIESIIETILTNNTAEVSRYKAGEKQLFGFLMGQVMKETKGSANPQEISVILKEKLDN
ncbi:MAG: Aspartyl/glutamyl-tRNA(Asn/Gln) amidotransferase subunit B, partial [Parcubacteria group bacterium GW2011_GWF2_44_8]